MSSEGDKRSYYRLFVGYALATVATGVAVVALSLLAFDLAGADAGAVIGTALSIKMLAYVVGAPLAAAFLSGLPRRPLLVGLDLVRAGAILLLPFVTDLWQLFGLVFAFTLASAAFTPAYQASVPFLLPDRRDYATSLARSRIVGELEGAISPLLAAALFLVLSLRDVFIAAMAAFIVSALLIAAARLPAAPQYEEGPFARLLSGVRHLVSDRRLRGLLPMTIVGAAMGGMVMVNTVVFVRGRFALDAEATAMALGVFGLGAVAGAIWVAKSLPRLDPRRVMLVGALIVTAVLASGALAKLYPTLLVLWAAGGFGAALSQVPAAALIRDSVPEGSYQTTYAAHFSAVSLMAAVGYAAAGWLGAALSLNLAFAILAAAAGIGASLSWAVWRPGHRSKSTG
jgi:MFS family permease